MNINGKCKLYAVDYNVHKIDTLEQLVSNKIKPYDAVIPSNVELELKKNGVLKDIFFGTNIHEIYKYELYDWWYEIDFKLNKKQLGKALELMFHGVDTVAEYYLNDKLVSSSENMLVEHSFYINNYVKEGGNKLFVRIKSCIRYAQEKKYNAFMTAFVSNMPSVRVRKPAHTFGWDIMPRAVSAGIFRDVEIIEHEPSEIENIYCSTLSADEECAWIWISYSLNIDCADYRKYTVKISGVCGDSKFNIEELVEFKYASRRIPVEKPKLWNVRGYGEQFLYAVKAELFDENRKLLHSKTINFGIRKINVDYSSLAGKENDGFFKVEVNGKKIFCKGANHVPCDAFHSRDKERLPDILKSIEDTNCNIIRCWGGNLYECNEFYEFCDKAGILVWQDFSMACNFYPIDKEFEDIISAEAEKFVKRVRNHPSILLYCGDNECDYFYFFYGFNPGDNVITRQTLKKAVFENDPHRKYVPSSPLYSPELVKLGDESLLPESHLWGPRNYFKSDYYLNSKAHFIGEIGYLAMNGKSSIEKFISKDKMYPLDENNAEHLAHCTSPNGKNDFFMYRVKLLEDKVRECFSDKFDNIDDFILASQIVQAEALKFFIEKTRTGKWDKTGIIWWNIRDGWPQFSDAVEDYYQNKKLGYYYVKRAQADIVLSMSEQKDWRVKVWLLNDGDRDFNVNYKVIDADGGAVLLSGSVISKANENKIIGSLKVYASEQKMYLLIAEADGKTYANHYYKAMPPFDFAYYKKALKKIAKTDGIFKAEDIAK